MGGKESARLVGRENAHSCQPQLVVAVDAHAFHDGVDVVGAADVADAAAPACYARYGMELACATSIEFL